MNKLLKTEIKITANGIVVTKNVYKRRNSKLKRDIKYVRYSAKFGNLMSVYGYTCKEVVAAMTIKMERAGVNA
jgi:hypothetical protein